MFCPDTATLVARCWRSQDNAVGENSGFVTIAANGEAGYVLVVWREGGGVAEREWIDCELGGGCRGDCEERDEQGANILT